jgi:hypothetical protein
MAVIHTRSVRQGIVKSFSCSPDNMAMRPQQRKPGSRIFSAETDRRSRSTTEIQFSFSRSFHLNLAIERFGFLTWLAVTVVTFVNSKDSRVGSIIAQGQALSDL